MTVEIARGDEVKLTHKDPILGVNKKTTYFVTGVHGDSIRLVNDLGKRRWYPADMFERLLALWEG